MPRPGATIGGRYRLDRRLGAGGMATVWLAVDDRLGRPVAVKVVADTLADDEQYQRRFEREARAAAAVSYSGVVSVLDYGLEDGRAFLVMQYVSGGSVAERLADPAAPPLDAERVARELLDALAHVHAAGIVHRDIKAANLLLDERDHIRLTDFGIAQPEDATSLTQTGMLVGTLRYLAPEVVAGEPATVRSDLYSAGIVVREVAGERLSPQLRRLVEALTAVAPSDRPATAAAAREILDRPDAAGTEVPDSPVRDGGTVLADGSTAPTVRAPASSPVVAVEAMPSAAPTGARPAASPRIIDHPTLSPLAALAALAAAAVLVAFVILLSGSGASGHGARPPAPAPAGAPASRQIDGLQSIVDYARSH